MFLRLLNESLLGAGAAGSRFRIPDTPAGGRHHPPDGEGEAEGGLLSAGRWPWPGGDLGWELRAWSSPHGHPAAFDPRCAQDVFQCTVFDLGSQRTLKEH